MEPTSSEQLEDRFAREVEAIVDSYLRKGLAQGCLEEAIHAIFQARTFAAGMQYQAEVQSGEVTK